jgi:hypothetical protein
MTKRCASGVRSEAHTLHAFSPAFLSPTPSLDSRPRVILRGVLSFVLPSAWNLDDFTEAAIRELTPIIELACVSENWRQGLQLALAERSPTFAPFLTQRASRSFNRIRSDARRHLNFLDWHDCDYDGDPHHFLYDPVPATHVAVRDRPLLARLARLSDAGVASLVTVTDCKALHVLRASLFRGAGVPIDLRSLLTCLTP